MTSLYPGLLFASSGLNKKSTPVKPEATPSEIDQRLGRTAFNGRPWPRPSPVSHVYDVRNSSTRMIILNNKLGRRPKGSRLRGQTDRQGDIQTPEPHRHIPLEPRTRTAEPPVSVSERFVPVFPPSVSQKEVDWVNKSQRPPMCFDKKSREEDDGSLVNPNHHNQCKGHKDYDILGWYNKSAGRTRPKSRIAKDEPSMSPILGAPGLTKGEKSYLTSIAKIYSVHDMKHVLQDRYNTLMWQEVSKDRKNTRISTRLSNQQYEHRTYRYSDYEKYNRYLNTPRKTQWGPLNKSRAASRATSAPGGRQPLTPVMPPSERPSTTQPSARSAKSPARQSAPRGKSGRVPGKKPGAAGGKARAESPLPLKPKSEVSPSPSMSDISEPEKAEEKKDTDEKASPNASRTSEQSAENQEKEETPLVPLAKPAGDSYDEESPSVSPKPEEKDNPDGANDSLKADEVGGKEEDERSPISARETTEDRGDSEEYTPVQTSDDRSGDSASASPKASPKGDPQESYQPAVSESKETSQASEDPADVVSPPAPVEGRPNTPPSPGKPASPVESGSPEQSNSQEKTTSEEESSSAAGAPGERKDSLLGPGDEAALQKSREGKDRPLSRLGGRDEFQVVKKDNTNSDDDYSDDDFESDSKDKTATSTATPETSKDPLP